MKVLVTGGGTGGHVYPALSILEAIRRTYPEAEFLYVGTRKGLEYEIVTKMGIPFDVIDVKGFTKKSPFDALKTIHKAFNALNQAKKLIDKFQPDLVIGTGGYVSGPIVMAGVLKGKKTAIHEQNVYPGKTNRLLAKMVDRIYITFDESVKYFGNSSKILKTGNPVREEFMNLDKMACRKELGIPDDQMFVLSFGGSGGAKKINECMMLVMNHFKKNNKIRLIHVTGRNYYEKFMRCMEESSFTVGDNESVKDYLFDMPKYICAADVVIGRSGATSLSEICMVKTPSILIPSPNVVQNHQEYNARALESTGVSKVILEADLKDTVLIAQLQAFLESPETLVKMKENFDSMEILPAADMIAKDLFSL